ncbi:MAG: alpha-mannosidase [Bacteroidetes bacterium]|nr:alpha-mannosidase [Bacteroidota bacterium]
MPNFKMFLNDKQIKSVVSFVKSRVYTIQKELEIAVWTSHEPYSYKDRCKGERKSFSVGDSWGGLFDCGWFRFRGIVPNPGREQEVVLLIDINGELCIVDNDGIPVRGLTTKSSVFDYSLGEPVKRVYRLPECFKPGAAFEIWADAGANDLFGELQSQGRIAEAHTALCHRNIRDLYYDLEVCTDALTVLDKATARYASLRNALIKVSEIIMSHAGFTDYSVEKARKLLKNEMEKRGGDSSLSISAVGHSHLDLAWLWPIRETIRKGARTFSTALELIEKYPDYVYGASQPQLFLWMKEYYPELYTKIKEKVIEGRIELQGAMWVEADTNLTGGESLVRQVLYGKRFFREEFSRDAAYVWLPDVFGYSAAMPQILKKSGVNYFFTQKLSWNRINKFPHHSFVWQGIDSSTVLTHMFPEDTYNSPAAPRSAAAIEKNYLDKGISGTALMVYGIGNGGGGPGAEHLERLLRIKNFAGLSPVKQERVDDFIKKWELDSTEFCKWKGELFLEFHHGTYTSQGRSKKWNRVIEMALREAEILSSLAFAEAASSYPSEDLLETWREVMLYQFHDIIPGSSIKRVYDESLARYEILHEKILSIIERAALALSSKIDSSEIKSPVLVFNVLPWSRDSIITWEGQQFNVNLPAMGYAVIDGSQRESIDISDMRADRDTLENDLLKICFQEDGSIRSIIDKELDEELIPSGEAANRFSIYNDLGDPWDFAQNYRSQTADAPDLIHTTAQVEGFCASVIHKYHYGKSHIIQRIEIVHGSRQINFHTEIDWNSPGVMVKTSFPLTVEADYADCEIQFGNVKRPTHDNTSWDLAKDEIPSQKWVDISCRNYGVALLNNGKYGYRVKDSVLELTLLRSVLYPGVKISSDADDVSAKDMDYSDLCRQSFTYALYPHQGDYASGKVVERGYELNQSLRTVPFAMHFGSLPPRYSFFQIDGEGIVIETVKKAEDDGDIVIRMYEAHGEKSSALLTSFLSVTSVEEVNLMEENPVPLTYTIDGKDSAEIPLLFNPFEIKTLKIRQDNLM